MLDIYKSGLYGGGVDVNLPRKLYMVRKNVQWLNDLDPSNDTLIPTSNYLFALCGKYQLSAQAKINSGGQVAPITPVISGGVYPLVVTASDFEGDGVTYNNPNIVGDLLMLFVSGYSQEWQFSPAFFQYTATGFVVTQSGFDMNNFDQMIIQQYFNP